MSVHSSKGGSYIAEDAHDYAMYQAALEVEAKRRLARAATLKRSQATADARGQYSMLDATPEGATYRY